MHTCEWYVSTEAGSRVFNLVNVLPPSALCGRESERKHCFSCDEHALWHVPQRGMLGKIKKREKKFPASPSFEALLTPPDHLVLSSRLQHHLPLTFTAISIILELRYFYSMSNKGVYSNLKWKYRSFKSTVFWSCHTLFSKLQHEHF